MSQEATADATDAAEEVEAQTEEEAFDPERAMATIKKQRESEAAALQKAKDLEARLAKYEEADAAKAEAEKALEVKVSERDATIKTLEANLAALHVKHDFEAKAAGQGIADPALAYLAAKEQGLLGDYDPKAGTVGAHDFEALAEKYPSFAPEEGTPTARTGDAGMRGRKGATETEAEQFNRVVREARGRRG